MQILDDKTACHCEMYAEIINYINHQQAKNVSQIEIPLNSKDFVLGIIKLSSTVIQQESLLNFHHEHIGYFTVGCSSTCCRTGNLFIFILLINYRGQSIRSIFKYVYVHPFLQDAKTEYLANFNACNTIYNISKEQLVELRYTKDKAAYVASDSLKEFNKCVIDKSGYVVADGAEPNWERMITFGVASGYDESTLRTNIDKCKPLYTGSHTVDEDWALYTCIFSF